MVDVNVTRYDSFTSMGSCIIVSCLSCHRPDGWDGGASPGSTTTLPRHRGSLSATSK